MNTMSATSVVMCGLLVATVLVNSALLYETTTSINLSPLYETTTVDGNLPVVSVGTTGPVKSAAAIDSWTKSEFPNPQLDVDDCGNNGSK